MKIASPQALLVYREIQRHGQPTAKEIAAALGILPNAIYRLVAELTSIGVVKQHDGYPATFSALPYDSAMGWYVENAQRTFSRNFRDGNDPTGPGQAISLITTRSALLKSSDKDASRAASEICLLVSGLEVPADTVMIYQRAAARGVSIKAILQKRDDTSPALLERWRRIATDVRFGQDLGIRLFVFDSKVSYLTSYSQGNKEEAYGLRCDYESLAATLRNAFEQRWQSAVSAI